MDVHCGDVLKIMSRCHLFVSSIGGHIAIVGLLQCVQLQFVNQIGVGVVLWR